jgi:hypothetical protein
MEVFPRHFLCQKVRRLQRLCSGILLFVFLVSELAFLSTFSRIAFAAEVVIDNDANQNVTSHNIAGSQTVFISDQVGYKFFRDQPSAGPCVYRKTTDGGDTWGSAVTVDSKTDCGNVVVWYDRWTPGDGGTDIHIATMNTGTAIDHVWYNRLDTTTDTLLLGATPVNTSTSSGQVATLALGTNLPTITKGTDGVVYIAISDASDSFIVSCSASCNTTTSWQEVGTSPLPLLNEWNILMPLAGGNILLINRQIGSPQTIRSQVWNGTAWSGTWSTVDTAVPNTTYDPGMAATIDHDTGEVFLAYAADNDNFTTADHDIRTAKYVSGSWSLTTDVFTNSAGRGLHSVAISLDQNTKNVYVAYAIRSTIGTATTANIHWATSTSAMSSWGAEQGPVNSTSANIYGVDLNLMSDERIFVSWFDTAQRDILGDTIADITPITKVFAQGNQTASINASSSHQYLGGTFVIQENVESRFVTSIILTESGTVAANTHLTDVRLHYEFDTSAPFDCVGEAYNGTEAQFGVTTTFSGANGTASFTDYINITPTQALCVYSVLTVFDSAPDHNTIALSINNPATDVLVTGSVTAVPSTPISFPGNTTILNDELTQDHYHWRNDDGSETTASSATLGIEDTPIPAILQASPIRLRLGISNQGSLSSPATVFRLEYATAAPTCNDAVGWQTVGVGEAWNMFDSSNVANGANTTDISVASGGVTNERTSFLAANGGVRDTTPDTGSLSLTATQFTELEYSIVATASSTEGASYCFRVSNAGEPLFRYRAFPKITVSADVSISTLGNQSATVLAPAANNYLGGTLVIEENVSSRNVTSITITESGTVNASTSLENIRLLYDLDTTAPYDCASESYSGLEAQFGATAHSFSAPNGTATFNGSVTISTSTALCVYVVYDTTDRARNGQTIAIGLANGGADVVVSAGTVSPTTPIVFASSTVIEAGVVDQFGYHFRFDNGTETTATSYTSGNANTPVSDFLINDDIRLRLGVHNTGVATTALQSYRLEFGIKITTCEAVGVWTPVGASSDSWDMKPSSHLTDGSNTTDISVASGGLTNPGGATFLTTNSGVKDDSDTVSPLALGVGEFTELEYSITSTALTAFGTTYCFRLTNDGEVIDAYSIYPELTTAVKRDFRVQRGEVSVTGTGVTLVAGVDYVPPNSTSSAFVRITNTHHTGAGRDNAGGGAQNARDMTAYITGASDLTTGFTLSRPSAAINNTRVAWEIVEFIGDPMTDNEVIVRGVGTSTFSTTATTSTGSVISGVGNNNRLVVYVTGVESLNNGRNTMYATQVTAEWDAVNQRPVFTRGAAGATAINLSYAVVEYVGQNWKVQRVEHTYSTTTVTEVIPIIPVNSLARTFIHTQKRMGALGNVNNYGHEVWLSSIGGVSFRLEPLATSPESHTSVAWIVENFQTSAGRMKVQRSNGQTNGGTEPATIQINFFTPIEATNNASIFSNTRVVGANTNFPLPNVAAYIVSTSTYHLWRSEATGNLTYRTEVVEWPTTGLAIRQNSYRFYVNNDALTPSDPWPLGASNIGENSPLTAADEPLGQGENIRVRMSVRIFNANQPAGLTDFKLQFAVRATTCSAVSQWTDVGAPASGAVWRGFTTAVSNGTTVGTNPPSMGELLLSVSDVAGSYVSEAPSPANPFSANPNEDIEFDWSIEQNGALPQTFYCFRMVRANGEPLDGYLNYPQIRTAGYTPVIKEWRWYADELSETPTIPLAPESVAPTGIAHNETSVLRVVVGELKNVAGSNIKFQLQFDETPLFTNPRPVVASTSCQVRSLWCYNDGAVTDNQVVSASLLTGADSCIAGVGPGCGVHNTSGVYQVGDTHNAGANREYAFYLTPASPRVGAVYYFRLYEITTDQVLVPTASSTYPSVVAESASLTFTISGLEAGTTTAGIVTDVTTTSTGISFGELSNNVPTHAAHRLTLSTNATEGYRVLLYARQPLQNSYGTPIASIVGTNDSPVPWLTGCLTGSNSCLGYHTTDATLSGINPTRFVTDDSYAEFPLTPAEVMYSEQLTTDVHDIVYKVLVRELQPAGDYETEVVYIAIPIY